MKINNYLYHHTLRGGHTVAVLYQHFEQQHKCCVHRPHSFHLITMIETRLYHVVVDASVSLFPVFEAEIAAFTDDGQFDRALVE